MKALFFCAMLLATQGAWDATAAQETFAPEIEEACVSSADAPCAQTGTVDFSDFESFVDGVVDSYREQMDIAGVTLAVVHQGRPVLVKGYGLAQLDPQIPVSGDETLFKLGSISKTFTWVALMQLIESGAVSLDDPVNDHLPEALQIPDDGYEEPILIRHLATHSAGWEDATFGHLFRAPDAPPMAMETYLARYRPERVRAPGQVASYSNYGAILAGAVVSHVSGEPFEEYVKAHIFNPLGMKSTTFYDLASNTPSELLPKAARLSGGFTATPSGWDAHEQEQLGQIAPAGSASSTAADMARFMAMLLNEGEYEGARILSGESVRRLRETLHVNAPGGRGILFGFLEYAPAGYWGYGHAGGALYFLSEMALIPELELGVFIDVNTMGGFPFAQAFPGLVVERYFPSRPEPEAITPPGEFAEWAGRFAGVYLTTRRSFTKAEKLFLAANSGYTTVAVNPDGYLETTMGAVKKRWEPIDDLVFREINGHGRLAFNEDADGAIVSFSTGLGIFLAERVGPFETLNWLGAVTFLALIAAIAIFLQAWSRRKIEVRQSGLEWTSNILMTLWAIAVVGYVGAFAAAMAGAASDPTQFIFSFPTPAFLAVSASGTALAVLAGGGALSLAPVWGKGSWPVWRRIRHSLAVILALGLAATLYYWNFVGFRYF